MGCLLQLLHSRYWHKREVFRGAAIPVSYMRNFCGRSCIDDKYELAQGTSLRNSTRVGSSIRKAEPFPSVDSTKTRPPCISTICLAIANPRPVPPLALALELST